MSEMKYVEPSSHEIDKCKRREQIEDSVAKTSLVSGEDLIQCNTMDITNQVSLKPSELNLHNNSHLISSTTSSLADTPGDSGVQCLDSEASEGAGQALMMHSLIGTEELACDNQIEQPIINKEGETSTTHRQGEAPAGIEDTVPELLAEAKTSPIFENYPDVILKALEHDFKDQDPLKPAIRLEPKKSMSEDIVFRRRCRNKAQNGASSQKKRVSFHEDILKNTKTDNIHIERGFISYRTDSGYCDRFKQKNNMQAERFSWCASGDQEPNYAADVAQQTQSDLLAYGDSNNKTGIFEYLDDDTENKNLARDKDNNNDPRPKRKMYGCDSNSSDSNFSCDSESTSSTSSSSNKQEAYPSHRKDKAQKSYSYDGCNNPNPVSIMRKTYFSEADIDQTNENKPFQVTASPVIKSVLKKNRYITTNIVEEQKQNRTVLNILDTNIFGSLKSFYKNFNFKFSPEKGLTETSTELTNVVEALPDVNQNKSMSKSLDSGFHIDDEEEEFVEINLNEHPTENEKPIEISMVTKSSSETNKTVKEGSPRHKLTLNMKNENDKSNTSSKYLVNCESMVYEHKGVSYSYVHDTFQTAFDAPKEVFVPIPESSSLSDITSNSNRLDFPKPMDIDSVSSRQSTPKKQYSRSVQDEIDMKTGISKHLSSPKRLNNKLGRRQSTLIKSNEDIINGSEVCSTTDNSTIKGGDGFSDDPFESNSSQKLQADKSALLNKYLKAVYQKKDYELRLRKNKFFQRKLMNERPFPNIIYPFKLVSKTFPVSAARVSRLIDKEIIENKRLSVRLLTADEPSYYDSFEDNVAIECSEKLRLQIFSYPNETLNRMMRVQSPYNVEDGSWTPMLVFITDYALYLASVKPGGTEYDILCRLPHDELDAIAVGPEHQYLQILDQSGAIVCSVVTGDYSLGVRFVSSLEWSARTSPLKPSRPPAVIPLTCRELAAAVARKRLEKKVPPILFYGLACSGDGVDRLTEAPGTFAPPLEGYLMCKSERGRRFEPCYFLLRAGILQWGVHPAECAGSLPNQLPLHSVSGVRRYVDNTRRPHCFEVAPRTGSRLLLAAPDEPTASSWLQSLLLHAAQALEEKDVGAMRTSFHQSGPPASCTVLVTGHDVISVRESMDKAFVIGAAPYLQDQGDDTLLKEYMSSMKSDMEILACGSIKNLTSFKIPDNDENWCCLEWSVCEALERGSGIALVFASSAELERFISSVEQAFSKLSPEPFPLIVVDGSKSTCSTAHAQFEAAWAHMFPAQQ